MKTASLNALCCEKELVLRKCLKQGVESRGCLLVYVKMEDTKAR